MEAVLRAVLSGDDRTRRPLPGKRRERPRPRRSTEPRAEKRILDGGLRGMDERVAVTGRNDQPRSVEDGRYVALVGGHDADPGSHGLDHLQRAEVEERVRRVRGERKGRTRELAHRFRMRKGPGHLDPIGESVREP